MATRFYPHATATPGISPGFAAWDRTTDAARRTLARTKQNSALTNTAKQAGATSAAWDVLHWQFVSEGLPSAGTLSGTVEAWFMGFESAAQADSTPQLVVKVYDSTGTTLRGTALAEGTHTAVTFEFADTASPGRQRRYPEGSQSTTLTDTAYQSGDVIVVEVGIRHQGAGGSTQTATVRIGDPTATADLSGVDANTTDGVPWIEFSADLFGGGPTPKTLQDSGAATDVLGVAAAVPLVQAGQATDSLSVSGAATPKTLADSGQAADALRVTSDWTDPASAVAVFDSGAAGDSVSVDAGATPKTLADQGAAADQLLAVAAVPLGDSGQSSDQLLAVASVPLAEQGVAVDSVQVSAAVILAEGGAAADSLTAAQFEPKTLAEAGQASDQLLAAATVPLGDAGAGAEQLLVVAQVPLRDSGAAADSLAADQGTPKTLQDSGAGVDTLRATAAVVLGDSGAAQDVLQPIIPKTLQDGGAGQDSLTVGQAIPKTLTDAGAATDRLLPAASVTLPDGGVAAEQVLVAALAILADAAQAMDTLAVAKPATYVIRTSGREPAMATSGRTSDMTTSSRRPTMTVSGREQGEPV